MSAKAVIWDMDGVIVDSGPFHLKSWQYAFKKKGVEFLTADFQQNFGRRNDAIVRTVLGPVSDEVVSEVANSKEEFFRDQIRHHIRAFPGAVTLIRELARHKFMMAIASSAPMENIDLILTGLEIQDCFQVIVTGREVAESKPSPLIFLKAAEKLGVSAPEAVVFEDAIAGVEAAKRAGMKCVAITNTNAARALTKADLVVDSLENMDVTRLETLYSDNRREFGNGKIAGPY